MRDIGKVVLMNGDKVTFSIVYSGSLDTTEVAKSLWVCAPPMIIEHCRHVPMFIVARLPERISSVFQNPRDQIMGDLLQAKIAWVPEGEQLV